MTDKERAREMATRATMREHTRNPNRFRDEDDMLEYERMMRRDLEYSLEDERERRNSRY